MRLSEGYIEVVFTQQELNYFYELCRMIKTFPSIDDILVSRIGEDAYIDIKYVRSNIRMYLLADLNNGKKSKFMHDMEKLLEWTEDL